MSRASPDIVVYTTVHPGALPYLRAWHASILEQSRRDFDLWIGIDQVSRETLAQAVDRPVVATFVEAKSGEMPARLRERTIERLIDRYSIVVFVDSDDIAAPDRVERAIEAISDADVACCALDLVDTQGERLGDRFEAPDPKGDGVQQVEDSWLLNGNIAGLGNSAFRTDCLRRCLPVPPDCVAMDWLLATRAWLHGARIVYDPCSGGLYRRHLNSVTPISPPFRMADVREATRVVLRHFECVFQSSADYALDRKQAVDARRAGVTEFAAVINASNETAGEYVCAVNSLRTPHSWWSCVAHPALEGIWRRV